MCVIIIVGDMLVSNKHEFFRSHSKKKQESLPQFYYNHSNPQHGKYSYCKDLGCTFP